MSKILTPKYGANKIANVLLKYNYQVKNGDILAGTVIGIERNQTLIDMGLKQAAFLPNPEILNGQKEKHLKINEIAEFLVLKHETLTNKTVISLSRLTCLRLWERFKQIDFKNMIIFANAEQSIWGGKLANFDGLKCFIPNSHLPKYYRRKTRLDNLLPMKILEVKDKRYQIIGSSRLAFLKKQSPSLQVGLTQIGCVLTIKPFGIFLNIYGIKCLLHISEISNQKIENLNRLYKKGDRIKVKIIYVNSSQGKIAVSAKQVAD
jgi:small subunit ribosomal protein S1